MTKKNINLRKKSVIILVWTNKMEKWKRCVVAMAEGVGSFWCLSCVVLNVFM